MWGGLLHVRGGVSGRLLLEDRFPQSSPRPWRCFPRVAAALLACEVFSTSVEVFLDLRHIVQIDFSLLHVRGGVSGEAMVGFAFLRSSPRPWRCFLDDSERRKRKCVFSTSVEVFPRAIRGCRRRTCLLHVRGGVS